MSARGGAPIGAGHGSPALVLVTGLFADRHDRRSIAAGAAAGEWGAALAFVGIVLAHRDRLWPDLAVILAIGIARAFGTPAERTIGDPQLGGVLVALGTPVALAGSAALLAPSILALVPLSFGALIDSRARPPESGTRKEEHNVAWDR